MTISAMQVRSCATALLLATLAFASAALAKVGDAGDETLEAATAAEQFAQARTAPGIVAPGAYGAAFASLSALPVAAQTWIEVTKRPYNSDDPRYRDPDFSNSSGGAGFVAGRATGLAVGGSFIYVGGANGGVFRSGDAGATWAPLTDALPTLSVGTIELSSDGSLWLATGEANTGATSYVGSGVYRLGNPTAGVFNASDRIGGPELESTTIGKLRFDGVGNVYAATSRGVWKHSASAAHSADPWTRVLQPVAGSTNPYDNICNDVAIDPKSGGRRIIANCAWRGGAAYNGFYISNDGGVSFTLANPTGALNPQDVGRGTFAYSTDGSQLYVVLESITMYLHHKNSVLGGIYNSPTGSINGPWNKIGDSQKLAGSGSALKLEQGYRPGVQAWYNQMIAVDPGDAKHLIIGLEEVFETRDAGVHWSAIAPYWNFSFDCWSIVDAKNTCPMAPHSDQHSIAIAGGQLYIGNDGGVYARPINGQVNADGHATDWRSLNANLRTLQYYSVGVGLVTGGVAVSGGLQDNGTSLLLPEDGAGVMGSIAGGDGVRIIVDPTNGCKILTGYPDLNVWLTENCGRSDGSASAFRDISPTDPNPRFIAPYAVDGSNAKHWVIAGEYIWTNAKGFEIQTAAEWKLAYDNGAGHATTALASRNDIIWSAWCGPCNNDGFARGISTNAGGTFHQVSLPASVPNRYIDAIAIDASDVSGGTVYVAFNGFSRRWTEGPGAGIGHLYKTTNAGATWSDVSGNLPDVPLTSIIVRGSTIVAGSDLAVLVSNNGGATWSRLGSNFPVTTVMDITIGPDSQLYAATHGRGIWSTAAPAP